ncbi:MAG: hypothetical protein Q8S94_12380 [Pseudohongiella sp.]|nr:hypothetical protein [Pseudohongiella sp.]
MVINLLPWRQALYKKRRRQTLQILVCIFVCQLVVAILLVSAHNARDEQAQQRLAAIQREVIKAEFDRQFLQQQYEVEFAKTAVLQETLTRWQQNADWQNVMRELGSLGTTVYVRQVAWTDNRLQLFGETNDAAAIRDLKNIFAAQQQNRQIELAPNGKYQFVISKEPEDPSVERGDS